MTAQPGTLVLIKIGDGGSPESFSTIGGLRASDIVLNNETLDSSNIEAGAARQLLANAGMNSISISGSGIFTDSASEDALRSAAFSNGIKNYRFYFANGDCLTGPFQIAAYERSGHHDGEEIYSLTLQSAGNIVYTVA